MYSTNEFFTHNISLQGSSSMDSKSVAHAYNQEFSWLGPSPGTSIMSKSFICVAMIGQHEDVVDQIMRRDVPEYTGSNNRISFVVGDCLHVTIAFKFDETTHNLMMVKMKIHDDDKYFIKFLDDLVNFKRSPFNEDAHYARFNRGMSSMHNPYVIENENIVVSILNQQDFISLCATYE